MTTARTHRTRDEAPRPASGLSLGRLLGVEIRLDGSLLVIFALVTFNLGAGVLPRWHPAWSPLAVWALALGAAVLFFASLLTHELAHALVARRMDLPVRRITLFLFGGLAHLEASPSRRRRSSSSPRRAPRSSWAWWRARRRRSPRCTGWVRSPPCCCGWAR